MSAEAPGPLLASPCVGTCTLDPGTGWCIGCGRDADELTRWRDYGEAERAAIWRQLGIRLDRLGQACRLLPWTPEAAVARIAELSTLQGAVLSMGVVGAAATFGALPGRGVVSRTGGSGATLVTAGATARLLARPGLRVFGGDGRLVLALHRSRFAPMPAGLAECAPEADGVLLDLGLGLTGFRFLVRTTDAALVRLLRRSLGRPLASTSSEMLAALAAAAPMRIVESPAGRIEIDRPWGEAAGPGPAATLSPALTARDACLASGLALPPGYLAAAVLVPGGDAVPWIAAV